MQILIISIEEKRCYSDNVRTDEQQGLEATYDAPDEVPTEPLLLSQVLGR